MSEAMTQRKQKNIARLRAAGWGSIQFNTRPSMAATQLLRTTNNQENVARWRAERTRKDAALHCTLSTPARSPCEREALRSQQRLKVLKARRKDFACVKGAILRKCSDTGT